MGKCGTTTSGRIPPCFCTATKLYFAAAQAKLWFADIERTEAERGKIGDSGYLSAKLNEML